MPFGFHVLIAAQFVSGLADAALLIVTIARLDELGAPAWTAPLLKLGFTLAYVVLAPFVGALADAWPKPRVMLASNGLKAVACALVLAGGDPLLAFALAGLGAAAYSPAKYGLVTELLPPQRLVAANGWIEVSTVGAVLLGTGLGGLLVGPGAAAASAWTLPLAPDAVATRLGPALLGLLALYAAAAALNLGIPASGARCEPMAAAALLRRFAHDNRTLWRDPDGRISLAVTTLFWGVGATLQFVVLRWADEQLGLDLHHAAALQAVTALGIVAGAVAAGRWIALRQALQVLPLGIAMGLLVPWMTVLERPAAAAPLLVAVGACAGFFVVPMNALLQHRGHALLSAGRSIAVQNFNENLGVLVVLATYALLSATALPLAWLIGGLGAFVAVATAAIAALQRRQARRPPALAPAAPESP